MGGLLNGTPVSDELRALLTADAEHFRWAAAAVQAQNAASFQLATGSPVIAIGGFNGTTNSPTLAQFKSYVAAGDIHYYISSGPGGPMTGTADQTAATQIQSWVQQNFTAQTVDGATVYDLTEGS